MVRRAAWWQSKMGEKMNFKTALTIFVLLSLVSCASNRGLEITEDDQQTIHDGIAERFR